MAQQRIFDSGHGINDSINIINDNNSGSLPITTTSNNVSVAPAPILRTNLLKSWSFLSFRKPRQFSSARRALVELGRNDRRSNARTVASLLTIGVESFKSTYNFDPVKMKPICSNNNNGEATNYEWEKMTVVQPRQQQLNCSLVSNNGRQMMLTAAATTTDIVVGGNNINNTKGSVATKEQESTVSSTTVNNDTNSQLQTTTLTTSTTVSIATSTQNEISTGMEKSELEKRLEINKRSSNNNKEASSVTMATAATAPAAVRLRQSKITDFAKQKKRVHSCIVNKKSEEATAVLLSSGSSMVISSNPSAAKRRRVL